MFGMQSDWWTGKKDRGSWRKKTADIWNGIIAETAALREAASAGAGARERRRVGAGAGYDGGVELSRGEEKTAGEDGKRGNVGRGKKSS